MNTLNITLIAAATLLSAALSTSALAADNASAKAADTRSAASASTQEKVRAEFIRARKAGELEFGSQFQIEETVAFKQDSKPAAVQLAAH